MTQIDAAQKGYDTQPADYDIGDVAFVRTTQEPVFILNVEAKPDGPTIITVRRPVKSDSGVEHKVEYFFSDELCSETGILEAGLKSKLNEEKFYKRYEESKQDTGGRGAQMGLGLVN